MFHPFRSLVDCERPNIRHWKDLSCYYCKLVLYNVQTVEYLHLDDPWILTARQSLPAQLFKLPYFFHCGTFFLSRMIQKQDLRVLLFYIHYSPKTAASVFSIQTPLKLLSFQLIVCKIEICYITLRHSKSFLSLVL